MQNVFSWNGVNYRLSILELKRIFEKLSADTSGRTQDGNMFIDPIGTFYNYTLTVQRAKDCSLAEYDSFWEAISAPEGFGTLKVPYNQSFFTFDAYLTRGEQNLTRIQDGRMYWDSITLEFIAKTPRRRPIS